MSISARQERFWFRKDKIDKHQKIRPLPYTIERCTIRYTKEEEEEEEVVEEDDDDDGGGGGDGDGGDDDVVVVTTTTTTTTTMMMIWFIWVRSRLELGIVSPPSHKPDTIFMRKKDLSRASQADPAGSPPVNLSMI